MKNAALTHLDDNPLQKPWTTSNISKMKYCLISIGVLLLSVTLVGCNNERTRNYTVGVINITPVLEQNLSSFKESLTELGYIEGKNIRYIYDGPIREMSKLPTTANTLVAAKVDLILSITTPATLAAKEATSDTGIPVVFSVVTDPVEAGILNNMQRPGGNITGVSFGIQEERRLEWLIRIAPQIKRIYVPYNAQDKSPILALKIARKTAEKLGVEVIAREVYDAKTLNDAVTNIPAEADAVFLLPDSLISTRLIDLTTIATKRKLPTSFPNINNVENYFILCSFGNDQSSDGKKAARLADQIFKGTKPADLPVEMSEFFLAINLKVAESINLTIPDEILRQADIIIR